jgi:diguanylate cyclase (GGDEF)-like protein/PAS domain S-box-containing protein
MLALSGLEFQEVVGHRDEDLFPAQHAEAYLPTLRRAMESGTPQSVECRLAFDGARAMVLRMNFVPLLDEHREITHVLCVAHDETQQREHEASLDRLNRTLRVLSECSQALVHASDESELLDSVCSTMLVLGGYDLVWVGLAENDAAKTVRTAMQSGHRRPHPDLTSATWGQDPLGLGPTGTAIRTGQPAICRDIASDPSLAPWKDAAAEHSLRACAAIPMIHAGETIGALTIYASEPRLFDAREMELLRELADDVTFGIMSRRAAAARRQAEDLLRLRDRVIESSSNGILINDLKRPNNPIIYVNPAFERMTGYSAREVIGRNPRFLIRTDRDQPGLERIRIALREKREGRAVLRSYHKDGTMFWVELSMSPVANEAGEATHFVTILNDVTERQLYQEELEHQAYHDALTGLANRNLLPDRIRQSILHAHRSNQAVAVLLLDLDHFKLVNDSLGHAVGDSLLVSVAERLMGAVREGDTVARIGGDEFVVVLADADREEHVTAATQRVMDAVVEPVVIKGKEFYMTASIGVSVYPRDGQDAETLLKNADVAMYRAKEHGRNNYQFYTPEMNERLTERISLVSGLRRALKRNEFRLYFQPLVDVRSGQVRSVEVLTHWHHPQRGIVSPSVFIPVTEETGLIRPLGEWVLRGACEQGRQWQDMGFPGIVVAVNLSANQFRQKNLTELVERALHATGLDPGHLELELTESVVMHNVDEVLSTLRDLKSIGVNISLDDFGTGYSSLSYLKRFPIDKLKIDRTFVRDIISNPEDAAIARAVIAMAHSLDMRVVAEGVETAEQLEFLRANHCDLFQGFYYARPLSATDSTDLLRSQWARTAVTGRN